MDIAELGLSVRSDGVVVADTRLRGLADSAKKAETATAQLIRKTEQMGRTMNKYVTLPLLAAGAASIKMASDFDSAMTKIITLVGVSRKEVAKFREEILGMASNVGKGPAELADALFAITSAGQRGAQALNTLEMAAKASAVGMGDARAVALASVAAVQAYGESNMSAAKSMEILIGTVEQGNIAAESLAPVLGRVMGLAAQLGVKFEDVGAFIATFSRLGVDAAESVTSLRGVLNSLMKVTPDIEAGFIKLNTTVGDFKQKIQDEGFINAFQGLVRDAQRLGVNLAEVVPEISALAGVLGVFGAEGTTAQDVLAGINRSVGTLEERFKAVQDLDPAFQMAQMRAELSVLAIEIGTALMPAFLELVRGIKDASNWFRELSPATQTFLFYLGTILAVIGPVLTLIAKLATAIKFLGVAFAAFGTYMTATFIPALRLLAIRFAGLVAALGFGPALYALLGPGGLFVVGAASIGLLAWAMSDAEREANELDLRIEELMKTMKDMGKTSFQLVMTELSTAIAENDAQIQRLEASLKSYKNVSASGALGADTNTTLMADTALQLAEAEAEAARLREQMLKLADAQSEMEVRTEAATEAVKTQAGAMQLSTEELDALSELLEIIDPLTAATERYAAAKELLNKALATGDIGVPEYERLIKLLQRSTLAMAALGKERTKQKAMDPAIQAELDAGFEYLDQLEEMTAGVRALQRMYDPLVASLKDLEDQRTQVNEAWANGAIETREEFDALINGINRAEKALTGMGEKMYTMLSETVVELEKVKGMFHEDSAAAEGLSSIIQVLNVVLGIMAVIKQLSEGDVYSAIPRALGVAALIASMGVNTGAAGTPTRTRQESQGTGSVLGDAEAKSESILKASEITADATSELVGINRGMLRALQSLQIGITGAVVKLAQAGTTEFQMPDTDLSAWTKVLLTSPLIMIVDKLAGGFLGNLLDKLFGGKAKLLDTGIQFDGGKFSDLVNGAFVKAFADIKVKKHIFDDYDLKEKFADVDDAISKQFTLVFKSIYDTVEQGATALGIPLDAIQQRLDAFELATTKISLKDLTAEEQQAELEAVFSQIFDNLAESVIPWIDQFQKVGEGLGETLVRVATSVQVMQEAIKIFGFTVNETDPEKFAQISVGLIEMAGGIEEFITSMSNFVDKFATEDWKNAIAVDAVTRAFAQLGTTLPGTREGLWEFVQGLDVSTAAGQHILTTILGLTDSLNTYYDIIEAGDKERLARAEEQLALERDFRSKFDTSDWVNTEAIDKATQAFAKLGLTLPSTREGLWKLVQSLDPVADAEKIAEIRNLIDTLDIYYTTLEDGDRERLEREQQLAEERAQLFDAEVEALMRIQDIADSVVDLLGNLRETILSDLSTPEQNYARARSEAERLAATLPAMTDPEQINATVKRIEELTRTAYGLLDEEQKKSMGQDFIKFLTDVQNLALERLGAAADKALANTAFTPEAVMKRFNELVTDPLILVVGKWAAVADRLLTSTPSGFGMQTNADGSAVAVIESSITPEVIRTAVEAGMQAGAQALVVVATDLANAIVQGASLDQNTGLIVASAISSIPARIEVHIDQSEFA